jgi:hypothetical protein
MHRTKKLGLAGTGATLVIIGALLVGGSAGATTAPTKSDRATATVVGPFVSVAPGGNGIASVACPAGTRVTGGGGQTSAFRIFFTDSYQSANSWVVRGTNTGTATESIRATATCLRIVLSYSTG